MGIMEGQQCPTRLLPSRAGCAPPSSPSEATATSGWLRTSYGPSCQAPCPWATARSVAVLWSTWSSSTFRTCSPSMTCPARWCGCGTWARSAGPPWWRRSTKCRRRRRRRRRLLTCLCPAGPAASGAAAAVRDLDIKKCALLACTRTEVSLVACLTPLLPAPACCAWAPS